MVRIPEAWSRAVRVMVMAMEKALYAQRGDDRGRKGTGKGEEAAPQLLLLGWVLLCL